VYRKVALLEEMGNGGPRAALLGTVEGQGPTAMPEARLWSDPISENPQVGATEVWAIYNFTEDATPFTCTKFNSRWLTGSNSCRTSAG
jgi:spore coat protein A, manganese oxidase